MFKNDDFNLCVKYNPATTIIHKHCYCSNFFLWVQWISIYYKLGIKFLLNDVFHKLVFWDVRTKSNFEAFLLLWCWISLLGLIALASKRLGHCGHISSTFGKYFEAKEITKNMKNSYAKTAGLLAHCLPVC